MDELRTHLSTTTWSHNLKIVNDGAVEEDDDVLHTSNQDNMLTRIAEMNDKLKEAHGNGNDVDEGRVSGPERHSLDHDIFEEKARLMLLTKDVFYFDHGVVVFWGLSAEEEQDILSMLHDFAVNPVSKDDYDEAFDALEFVYDPKRNAQKPVRMDRMRLRTIGGSSAEKLAMSYGIAQSSKLFVHESRVRRRLDKIKDFPRELANTGRIRARGRDLNKLIGQMFVEKTDINLFSSILDTPRFLWENDLELNSYESMRDYLEVDNRVELLNKRLETVEGVLEVLGAQVQEGKSTRLEWIIIWLISVEIVMGIQAMPLTVGRKIWSSILVPGAVLAFNKWRT